MVFGFYAKINWHKCVYNVLCPEKNLYQNISYNDANMLISSVYIYKLHCYMIINCDLLLPYYSYYITVIISHQML